MTPSFETVGATRPKEHLPTDALARLRQLLLHELRSQLDQAREPGTLTDLTAEPPAGAGHFEVAWEIAEGVAAWSLEAVEDLVDALARMDDGTYGLCQQCAASIPLKRLEAIPNARFCPACQGRRDAMR